MIQEYLAISIFGIAIIYTAFSILRFIVDLRKNHLHACGNASCSCNQNKQQKLIAQKIEGKNLKLKQVRLK